MVRCTSCQREVPQQLTYCPECGHESQARPGRCHCPSCQTLGIGGGWKALEAEEDAARMAWFETLPPDVAER